MSYVKVHDETGNTLTLLSYNGQYYGVNFSKEALANMKDFPLRESDVILCSYSKSGCNWVWEILRQLQNGKIYSGAEVLSKNSCMMEWQPYWELTSLPSPRVLNNHLPFWLQPQDMLAKKPKIVFYYRNFKDVAVSFYYHHKGIPQYEYNGDFKGHLLLMVSGKVDNGSPFEYIRSWEKGISDNPDLPVFIGSYEDLKENTLSEVRRLSEFLGKDYSDEFLQQVCDATNFERMKQHQGKVTINTKDGEPVMFRKGQVGDWKNHFTVALDEWFERIIKHETLGSKLKYRYSL